MIKTRRTACQKWCWLLSLCSIFATTGNTAEDISYAVEHCCASWEWRGVSSIFSSLPLFSQVYSGSGPICGRIVDSRGPRILLACSFVFLLGRYSCFRYLYDCGLVPDALSTPVTIIYYAVRTPSLQFPDRSWERWGRHKFYKFNRKNVPRRSSMYSLTFLQSLFYSLLYDSEHPRPVW